MALIVADRVKEASASTGTGAFALSGAPAGFRAFSAVCSVGDTCYYTIQAVDASGVPTGDWEVGLGAYSATNTLTRTTVLASSNAGAAVNFATGAKQVWLDIAAQQITNLSWPAVKYALVYKNTNQALPPSTWTNASFEVIEHDAAGFFSSAAPTRLTVPAGVSKVRLVGNAELTSSISSDIRIVKNNTFDTVPGQGRGTVTSGAGNISTAILKVVPGDYFEVRIFPSSTATLNGQADTWFSIEVVERISGQ